MFCIDKTTKQLNVSWLYKRIFLYIGIINDEKTYDIPTKLNEMTIFLWFCLRQDLLNWADIASFSS
jgi:hypothetical protein